MREALQKAYRGGSENDERTNFNALCLVCGCWSHADENCHSAGCPGHGLPTMLTRLVASAAGDAGDAERDALKLTLALGHDLAKHVLSFAEEAPAEWDGGDLGYSVGGLAAWAEDYLKALARLAVSRAGQDGNEATP